MGSINCCGNRLSGGTPTSLENIPAKSKRRFIIEYSSDTLSAVKAAVASAESLRQSPPYVIEIYQS